MIQQPHVNTDENIRQGMIAIRGVIRSHVDDYKAMFRADIGNIAFYWGKEGDATSRFLGGYGLSKIIAEKGDDVIADIVRAVARGRIVRRYGASLAPRAAVEYQGQTAVLARIATGRDGLPDTWLLAEWIDLDGMEYQPEPGEQPFADVVPGMIAKPEVIEQPVMEAAQDENSWRDALNKATTYQDIEDVFSALFGLKPVDEFAGKGIKTDTNIDGEVIELKGNGRIAKLRKSGKWEIYDGEADAKNLYGTAENIADACEIILEQAKSVRKQDAVIIMEAASTGDWQTLKSIFEKAKPEYVPGMFDTAE